LSYAILDTTTDEVTMMHPPKDPEAYKVRDKVQPSSF